MAEQIWQKRVIRRGEQWKGRTRRAILGQKDKRGIRIKGELRESKSEKSRR